MHNGEVCSGGKGTKRLDIRCVQQSIILKDWVMIPRGQGHVAVMKL